MATTRIFYVKGTIALKKAFAITLIEMGYKPWGSATMDLIDSGHDIQVNASGKFFLGDNTTVPREGTLKLPAQWDEAIEAATKPITVKIGTGSAEVSKAGIYSGGEMVSLTSLKALRGMMANLPTKALKMNSPWGITFDTVNVGCTKGITVAELDCLIAEAASMGLS